MRPNEVQRKLAAILAADVVSYSRLMGADEEGTLASLTAHRTEFIEPCIAEHRGRVVKTTGDGLLAEFASVVDAVRCGVAFQEGIRERNADFQEEKRIVFRIGVNLGDIIIQDNDVFGDGVNIAARLESLAESGGICISSDVYRQVRGRIEADFEDIGEQRLKNIPEPIRVYKINIDGGAPRSKAPASDSQNMQQEIRFCTAADGVRIAFATAGQGPPLVKTANWLNHLEYDWQSPVWRHLLQGLAEDHLLIRYDARGNGLSDWDVSDISFEAFVRDLETVVDAVGLDRFPLLGISQGCSVSIAYAVRHPERVSHLVLYGGYARGARKRGSQEIIEREEAMATLMRQGWGQENPMFRQIFTSLFIPEATPEQMKWFNDLQRMTASPENAVRIRKITGEIDVTHLLSEISVPTLVLHCRDEVGVPFEEGRLMATIIPGARFVALEGRNHLILENEPASPRFLEEVKNFLS